MKRAQYNDCSEEEFLAKTVSLSKHTISEDLLISSLLAYLSENFRGVYHTEEIEGGGGYLRFAPEGFAYCLRHLLRAGEERGSVGISYHSKPSPVLCLSLPRDILLTDDIKREIRSVAASSDISFYGLGDNRFCLRFDPAERLHLSVYAPVEDILLAAFPRMLSSIAPKKKGSDR